MIPTKNIWALAATLCLALGLHAQTTYYWIGSGGSWATASNWSLSSGGSASTVAPGTADIAVFDANGGDCNLAANATIGEVVLGAGYANTLDLDGHSLTVAGGFTQHAGTFQGGSAAVGVGGTLHLIGGEYHATTGTTTVGADIIEEGEYLYPQGGKFLLTGTGALIDITTYFYDLEIGTGASAVLGNGMAVAHNLHLGGPLNAGEHTVFIGSSSATAITGGSGIYLALGAEAYGIVYWGIGESTGTYTVPMLATPTGPVIPVAMDVTTAGDAGTGPYDGFVMFLCIELDDTKPQDMLPNGGYYNATGGNNADMNINRLWGLVLSGYDESPGFDLGLAYADADLTGITATEANLRGQVHDEKHWTGTMGTLNATANTIALTGLTLPTDGRASFVTLVDNTSPNKSTYGGNTGLTCSDAVELDSIDPETVFEMVDTVMWFRFTATDSFMHIYVGFECEPFIGQLTLFTNTCDSLVQLNDTLATISIVSLILNQCGLETDSIYWVKISGSGSLPCNLKGPIAIEPLLPPVVPSPVSFCNDTIEHYTFSNIEAGVSGDQIEWSLFEDFRVSYILASPADITNATVAGVQDIIWLRSRHSLTSVTSSSVSTTATVSHLPNPPSPTPMQYLISDTAVTFVFDSIYAGGGGTHVQWSFDSLYATSYMDASPVTVTFVGDPGSLTVFWVRSIDSLSGCYSASYNGIGIVDTLEDTKPSIDTTVSVCSGGSWALCLEDTELGYLYELLNDTSVLDAQWGTGDTLCLNSGIVDSIVVLTVKVTDTLSSTLTIMDTLVVVIALDANDTLEFNIDNLLLEVGDTFLLNAMSQHGAIVMYEILGGGATIDSLTGRIDSIATDFTVRAFTVGNPCDTAEMEIFVRVTDLGAPDSPEPIVEFVDSTDTVDVVFYNILPGTGGNQIEWSEDEDFTVSYIVAGPADITVSVPVETEKGIWLRTRSTENDRFSKAVFTSAKVAYDQMSAGLLDKTYWKMDENYVPQGTWYEEMSYPPNLLLPGQNPNFINRFALNYVWDAGVSPLPGNPNYCPNHIVNWGLDEIHEIFNYGKLNCVNCVDGIGEEVIFDNKKAVFTATKLPQKNYINCTGYPSFEAFYRYSSGMMHQREVTDFAKPGMIELRCKLPIQDLVWPAFWMMPGGGNAVEIDFFDNSGGPEVLKTFVHTNYDSSGTTVRRACFAVMDVRTPCNLGEDWHTYNFMWTDKHMIAFYDGKEYWSMNRQISGKDDFPYPFQWHRILLSLQTRNYVNGDIYQMWVDHMRYYQPKTGPYTCDVGKLSLQYLLGCNTPQTMELLSSTGINNHKTVKMPANIGQVSSSIGNHKMSILKSSGTTKIYYQGEGAFASQVYISSIQNGHWKEYNIPYLSTYNGIPFRVAGEVSPMSEDFLYCKANYGTGYPTLGILIKVGNMWKVHVPYVPKGCAGSINVGTNGSVIFRGYDSNLYRYNPYTNRTDQLTNDGSVAGNVKVHSNGYLVFYTDQMHRLRMAFLSGYVGGGTVVVGNLYVTDQMALDEKRNRLYFIDGEHDVYYYTFGCMFGCGTNPGAIRLGCGSKEPTNNASLCAASSNAASDLLLSPDGNLLFYKATDGRIWYYFNDKENTIVAYENWNKTKLTSTNRSIGPIAMEPGSYGHLYYIDHNTKRLREIGYTTADNPVRDCWDINVDKGHQTDGSLNKTESLTNDMGESLRNLDEAVSVQLYPNPSDGHFTFTVKGAPESAHVALSVSDLAGKVVFRSEDWENLIEEKVLNWDADNHPQGYYIYSIIINGKKHIGGKLIKL